VRGNGDRECRACRAAKRVTFPAGFAFALQTAVYGDGGNRTRASFPATRTDDRGRR
jgi:hypothetical protein